MLAPVCVLAFAFALALLVLPACPAYAADSPVPQGSLTLASDAYAVESPAPQADAAPAPESAASPDQTTVEVPASTAGSTATEQSSDSGYQAAGSSDQSGSPHVESAGASDFSSESNNDTNSNATSGTSMLRVASSTAGANGKDDSLLKGQSTDDAGSISVLDPHEADITYSASDGGSVALGSADNHGDPAKSVSEHHDNSLVGESVGATAIPQAGYHFVRWIDVATGSTISTSLTFAPDRPDGGWPVSWNIKAVFARDVYVVRLDPNGGTAGGGGGSSGVITMEVTPGSNFQIPVNGSDAVSLTRAGSAFVGWNVASDPSKAGSSGSYAIADGQILDAATESALESFGFLNLDWSNENTPTITFYAQWLIGQIAIKYKADDGGMIAPYSGSAESASTLVSEIMDANTGVHAYDSSSVGPSGASAIADSRKHFAGWTVSGSTNKLDSNEATSADLSSDVVTRMTYYPNNTNMASKYHAATFTASFAPNTYSFNYEANGGKGSIDSTSLTYGSTATAASSGLTRSGYQLTGWNLAANGSGSSIALGATLNSSSIDSLIASGNMSDEDAASTTLYAQWKYVGGEEPDPQPTPTPKPTPKPVPIVLPDPEPEPATKPEVVIEPEPAPEPTTDYSGYYIETRAMPAAEYAVESTVATIASDNAKVEAKSAADENPGLLASSKTGDSNSVVVAYDAASGSSSYLGGANGEEGSVLDQLMTPGGLQEASTTVAAVAAVGTLMGLVGLGASVAGAAIVGAATIGTAGAVGLTTAADLAADLAAAGAAGGAAAKRRRKDEEDDESQEGESE